MRRAFHRFIGVDLGGGKGKTTAVTRLRFVEFDNGAFEVVVEDQGVHGPWYDEKLVEYLLRHADDAVLAIDAPLTLTACVRCTLPVCPGISSCEVPTVAWFRKRDATAQSRGYEASGSKKPRYTPYTQRATEVVLHEDFGIIPRETLGQGMGPLTARMAYLRRALAARYRLNENLLEVYPKATLTQLFPDPIPQPGGLATPSGGTRILFKDANGMAVTLGGQKSQEKARGPQSQVARLYKRSGQEQLMRTRVLEELPGLRFAPGQWREHAVQNDHQFDALVCAYTAFLWSREGWELPAESQDVFAEDGWIWFPRGPISKKTG